MGRRKATLPSSIRSDPITPSKLKQIDDVDDRRKKLRRSTRNIYRVRNSGCPIMDLPSDLIVRIVAKLPFKSIVHCKLVCKPWEKALKNPYIYSKGPQLLSFARSGAGFSYKDTDYYLTEISEDGNTFMKTPFKPRLPNSLSTHLFIEDSCNGLLLLASDKNLGARIWNPIMGGSDSMIILPKHKDDREEAGLLSGGHRHFLGYISAANRFKVLKFVWYMDKDNLPNWVLVGLIFTLGIDDRWRCLPDLFQLQDCPDNGFSGVIVEGVFHWISKIENNECIHTFDLENEKQDIMPFPYSLSTSHKHVLEETVYVFKGQLSVIQYSICPSMVIWIMKEYGVAESWTKIRIRKSFIPNNIIMKLELFPLEIMDNGVIVFLCERLSGAKTLMFYDSRLKNIIKVEDLKCKGVNGTKISYAPSFVPLLKAINGDVKASKCHEPGH